VSFCDFVRKRWAVSQFERSADPAGAGSANAGLKASATVKLGHCQALLQLDCKRLSRGWRIRRDALCRDVCAHRGVRNVPQGYYKGPPHADRGVDTLRRL
jgi:hypothetical protein